MFSRRHILTLIATAAPGLAIGCSTEEEPESTFDPEAVPESTTRFPRTPIAGDMTDTRVVITFHVADDAPVTLRLWTESGDVVVDQAIEGSGDGFHKVQIDELLPGTAYQFAVFGGSAPEFDDRSLIVRFRTAPASDQGGIVRIALLSCIGQGTILPDYYIPDTMDEPTEAPFEWPIFSQVQDLDLDFFVHLGDQAYLDFVWAEAGGTLDAYLHAWGYYHGGGYRDVYPYAGLYATWDDHEATDNGDFDPWDMTAEEAEKLENAQAAWYKTVPIDAMTRDEAPVWRAFRWGSTLELVLVDCRYELGPDRLMSKEQLDWLIDRITTSPCRFVCVATPKPFAEITSSTDLLEDSAQRWESYPPDRERLAAALDDNDLRKVIFVTGDIHTSYLGRTKIDGDAVSETAWEVCTTSGNINPFSGGFSDEQFDFVEAAPHIPVLTFDPDAGTVHVAFYDPEGAVAFEQTLDDVG